MGANRFPPADKAYERGSLHSANQPLHNVPQAPTFSAPARIDRTMKPSLSSFQSGSDCNTSYEICCPTRFGHDPFTARCPVSSFYILRRDRKYAIRQTGWMRCIPDDRRIAAYGRGPRIDKAERTQSVGLAQPCLSAQQTLEQPILSWQRAVKLVTLPTWQHADARPKASIFSRRGVVVYLCPRPA